MILTAMGFGKNSGQMYPDSVGKRAIFVGSGTGPVLSSSSVATADVVSINLPNYYIDAVIDGASIDGLYSVQGFANQIGPRATWKLFYYSMSSGTIQNSTNLSGSTFVISAFVGQY